MGLFRRKRPQGDDHLAAAEQCYANAVRQSQVIDELNELNWKLWTEFRSDQSKRSGRHKANLTLHDEAHEDITPPWEES